MASEIKRLITRALDSLAVDGLLHAAGQDEPLPVRVVPVSYTHLPQPSHQLR